ncbi:peptidyl-prolyl cis-trans isomerase [Nocardioides sp. WS12]|uniref:peptidyl-prolyl cis-trans isomerase n=1 Tax=Nocardioides sp. WS12 TaxID=2486272 RepID=UPI0015FB3EE9|nr:peptidyl-prolyl cis-trans isomerase [Nocardioides sp. WS12]
MIDKLKQVLSTPRGRLVAGILVVALAGAGVAFGVTRADDLPEDAAFRYGDRVVTTTQLDDRLEVLEALYGVKRPDDADKKDDFNRDSAKSMVVSLVLADAAAKRDIVISDKEAQTELDKLIDQQLTGGRDAFVEFLSTSGISERDVLDEIRAQLATSRLVDEVTADVPEATEAEAQKKYDDNEGDMVTPEGRQLVNVVVETRADADRVARLAGKSGKLSTLAATWSLDGSTKDDGGRLGLVTADQLEDGYGKIAFSAAAGEIFGPVKTSYGWNVGQVVEVVKARPVSFTDVKAEIIDRLSAEARLKVWRDFLAKELKGADVEYADGYLPDDPTAPPANSTPTPAADPPASGAPATETPAPTE